MYSLRTGASVRIGTPEVKDDPSPRPVLSPETTVFTIVIFTIAIYVCMFYMIHPLGAMLQQFHIITGGLTLCPSNLLCLQQQRSALEPKCSRSPSVVIRLVVRRHLAHTLSGIA